MTVHRCTIYYEPGRKVVIEIPAHPDHDKRITQTIVWKQGRKPQ